MSRGRIRSEAAPGAERRSRYARDDVERLRARTRERRNPERAAEQALHWGLPILESSITLIGDGRIYYHLTHVEDVNEGLRLCGVTPAAYRKALRD